MSQNTTPFIPPLSSPHPSPQHNAPVIPQQNPNDPISPSWYNYSQPGAYPVYPSTPQVHAPFIPHMSPAGMTPGVIPGAPLPAAGYPGGVSQDYTGYPPTFGQQSPYAAVPQRTPWAAPAAPPVTPWNQPNSAPLPPTYGTPWGGANRPLYPAFGGQPMQGPPPPQQPFSAPGFGLGFGGMPPGWPGQQFTPAPAMQQDLWGILPGMQQGIQQAMGGPPPPAAQPMQGPLHRAQTFTGDRMDPFMEGDHYGPVLEPFLVRVVQAQLKLNPLIEPVLDTGPERPFLKWNMLFPSSTAQRSTDPSHVSWSKGRHAPATFPRVTSIRIVSETYPWMIEVHAQAPDTGVTCGEVIDSIQRNLQRLSQKEDYERLPTAQKRTLAESYRHNRSRSHGVPGGQLGEGMKRLDFLRNNVQFGGIEVNETVVKRICGDALPCTFVLKCQHMFPMTQQELRDHQARQRSAASQRSASQRSASRNSTRIRVEPASDIEDDGDSS